MSHKNLVKNNPRYPIIIQTSLLRQTKIIQIIIVKIKSQIYLQFEMKKILTDLQMKNKILVYNSKEEIF